MRLASLLIAVLLFSGCDLFDGVGGAFDATVTGDGARTVSGHARTVDENGGQTLYLGDDDSSYILVVESDRAFAPGVYDLSSTSVVRVRQSRPARQHVRGRERNRVHHVGERRRGRGLARRGDVRL